MKPGKNLVVLELPLEPFFIAGGGGTQGKEILRSGGWRKHLSFEDGELRGVSIGCTSGRAAVETRETYRAAGVKFYACGEWQSEFSHEPQPGIFSELGIKPEVLAVIKGKAAA